MRIITATALAIGLLITPGLSEADEHHQSPVVLYLSLANGDTPTGHLYREAFLKGMQERGYAPGTNLTFEIRYYANNVDAIGPLIRELARTRLDAVVTSGAPPAIRAIQAAAPAIPIVLWSDGDPVSEGLIASLAHPGGTITGNASMAPELTVKQLELLKELVPRASRIAFLQNPNFPGHAETIEGSKAAAATLGVTLRGFAAGQPADIEPAFAAMATWPADALVVLGGPLFSINRALVGAQAAAHGPPSVCYSRELVESGCLISYAPNASELNRRAATFVDKILRGAKPDELPVEQPTIFELIVNLKTARALGITIPPTLLARADEVIE
jgi:putative ABC transport system substrate-binding protein